ncbi:MAG: nucleotidyltransferase, partial [Candidatus Muiribacteriota bacterium]
IADKKCCFNDIRKELPEDNRAKVRIPCAWEEKGTIMRNIMDNCGHLKLELIDGVKILNDDGSWVLLIPDSDKPYFNVYAEGKSKKISEKLAEEYVEKIKKWKK